MKMTESTRVEMHRREAERRGHPAWLFICGVFLGVVISFLMGIRA